MTTTTSIREYENDKLQQFADLCADIESQVTFLPGLACLNYPRAIQPIAEKLPQFVPAKWEKEIANYSDNHRGTYPPFSRFSKIVQEQAKIMKNNPNILAGKEANPAQVPLPKQRRDRDKKSFKTDILPPAENKEGPGKEKKEDPGKSETKSKHCPCHERGGHNLSECKAFSAKSLEGRTQWIMDVRLCFRCFSTAHIASECNTPIHCTICGDKRHSALLPRGGGQPQTGHSCPILPH